MKKIAIACVMYGCSAVMAAGAYDGIYADTTTSESYVSVQTSNNRVIATAYDINSISGIVLNTGLGNLKPTQINTWNLLGGTITGSTASLSGQLKFNACNVVATVNFDSTGAYVTLTSSTQTAVGASTNFNCGGLTLNTPIRFTKIF